jgi:hypothetical protein
MRRILLLPLALSAAFTVGACRTGTDDTEQTAFQVPKRDLTLQQANAPQMEVASPLELARAEPTRPQSAPHQQTQRRPIQTRRHVTPAAPASQAEPYSGRGKRRRLRRPLRRSPGRKNEADPNAPRRVSSDRAAGKQQRWPTSNRMDRPRAGRRSTGEPRGPDI